MLDRINTTLITYWPCATCQLIGYCFCPCTLGLSFLCPGLSISEAKSYALQDIATINEEILQPKGFFMVL